MSRLPDFIIVGAMKCATSTLHEQLNNLSGFYMSNPKELQFFSDDPIYAKGIDWYQSHFDGAQEHDLCGESSTHYTKQLTYPKTVERMREHLSSIKLIYVMRHPVDRLVSQYVHQWTERQINCSLSEALKTHLELVDYSSYYRQLKPYFETFGRENILPVFAQRLRFSPQEELNRVCRFLGYSGSPIWCHDKDSQNVSSERMRQNKLRDQIAYAPGITWIRKKCIPTTWRNRIKNLWMMNHRPELTAEEKTLLELKFDKDLKQLGSCLGVELNCHNFNEITRNTELNWASESLLNPELLLQA